MLHLAFIKRQVVRSRKQAAVFVLCVILSMITLIALNGFSTSVHEALMNDARRLQAGDIIIKSRYDFTPALKAAVARFAADGRIATARMYEFYSIVRTVEEERSLLAMLKVAGRGYPFYGQVVLASGHGFEQALQPGTVIVESGLLERLALSVGDVLRVGNADLTIADVVTLEPDRPVTFFHLDHGFSSTRKTWTPWGWSIKPPVCATDCYSKFLTPPGWTPLPPHS